MIVPVRNMNAPIQTVDELLRALCDSRSFWMTRTHLDRQIREGCLAAYDDAITMVREYKANQEEE